MIEYLHDGVCDVLFEAERDSLRALPQLPDSCDAGTTVAWMQRVLAGDLPLPSPLANHNQLACCLYGCGRASDFNQAKALVAVEGNGLTTV